GTHGPLFRLFFDYLPGWNVFRDQERAVVLLALAGSILAGYGMAALRVRIEGRPAEGAPVVPSKPPGKAVAGRLLGLALALVSLGNLWWANAANNLSGEPPPDPAPLAAVLGPVAADPDIFRVRVSEGSLGHNAGNLLHLQLVSGDSPFELTSFRDWTEDQPPNARTREWQVVRLTNSHYVISGRDLCAGPCSDADGLELLDRAAVPGSSRLLESIPGSAPSAPRDLLLYRVLFPLPRAFFLTQARVVASEREAIDVLNQPDFDAQQTVLLQAGPARSLPFDPAAPLRADVVGYAAGFVDIRATSDRPAYLFTSEVAYPDWQATIDGQPAPILTADG